MGSLRSLTGKIGLGILGAVILISLIGPYLAPDDPARVVGIPYASHGLLGTDGLGRDVLSRVLWGGRSLVLTAIVATVLGYALGLSTGLFCGLNRTWAGALAMRGVDVLLAFPPLILLLVVATGAGHSTLALILAVAVIHLPSIARIVRSAVLEQRSRAFVEAAVVRGETSVSIMRRELVPNIMRPLLADGGLRLTWSILLIASVSFLGLGAQPPDANWALMISENRPGLEFAPWGVVAPAIMIALLTVGVNLVADAFGQDLGDSRSGR
jgi:ABC-type dipeptide/oligopeptide/nickel transport system permease subunit